MPGLSRRRFCAGTALAGASLAAAGCESGAGPSTRSLAELQAAVGSTFTVGAEGRALRLARVRVHAPPIRKPEPRGESFTLVFEATQPMALAQGSHPVRHARLGEFSIFLVPRGASGPAGLPTYAATYCRL